jgi:hypothetical protein
VHEHANGLQPRESAGSRAAEAAGEPTRSRGPVRVSAQVEALLAKRQASLAAAKAAQRLAEAARRSAERARTARLRQWMAARVLLRAAVSEIDLALAPSGYYLSMADDVPHPAEVAAVEIRLCRDGRPGDRLLDITLAANGRQTVRELGGAGLVRPHALPAVGRVSRVDYLRTVLSYVERAIVDGDPLDDHPCAARPPRPPRRRDGPRPA